MDDGNLSGMLFIDLQCKERAKHERLRASVTRPVEQWKQVGRYSDNADGRIL